MRWFPLIYRVWGGGKAASHFSTQFCEKYCIRGIPLIPKGESGWS